MAQVDSISVKNSSGDTVDVATLTAIAKLFGEVQTAPTANTLLDRVKSLQTLLAAPLAVTPTSSAHDVSAAFSRPADTAAYAAGDIVGSSLTFTAAGKAGGAAVMVTGVQLEIDVAAVPSGMGAFRLHLYSVTPPSALADNAVFDLTAGDRSAYLGFIDIPVPADLGATLYVEVNSIGKQCKLSSQNVYGYLQTIAGFTPGSADPYKITLHTVEI